MTLGYTGLRNTTGGKNAIIAAPRALHKNSNDVAAPAVTEERGNKESEEDQKCRASFELV